MKYFSTTTFRKNLRALTKKNKNTSVKEDLLKAYPETLTSHEVESKGIPLIKSDNKILLKSRIQNSAEKTGKRGGFRLICLLDKFKENTTFFYPFTAKNNERV